MKISLIMPSWENEAMPKTFFNLSHFLSVNINILPDSFLVLKSLTLFLAKQSFILFISLFSKYGLLRPLMPISEYLTRTVLCFIYTATYILLINLLIK